MTWPHGPHTNEPQQDGTLAPGGGSPGTQWQQQQWQQEQWRGESVYASPGPAPQGYGPQGPPPHGYAPPGSGPGAPRVPGRGSRLLAFLTRDVIALSAALVATASGLMLLITPSLAWLRDTSGSLVDGTMSVSARGTISLDTVAERTLSESDAFQLGLVEMGIQSSMGPLSGMLLLSAALVMIGGLLMLTTARQLGAVVALIGVIPQIFAIALSMLMALIYSDSSPSPDDPPGPAPGSDSDFGVGAGLYLTIIIYVIVIACATVAALRPDRGSAPPPASAGPGQRAAPQQHYVAPRQDDTTHVDHGHRSGNAEGPSHPGSFQ